jgi:3-phosphoshikimate 1-carboxyvinyltransferase
MVNAVGGEAHIDGDELTVVGGRPLTGGSVCVFGDHRIAMSAAVLANYCASPVTIDDADAVAKSYPGFWDDFDALERAE